MLDTESAQVIIAGDIFHDGWRTNKCSPELINFCIDNFRISGRKIYAIPGQHDLPHHRFSDIHKSVYWTLTKCKSLTDISNTWTDMIATNMRFYGIPWEGEIDKRKHEDMFKIAVLHRYIWREGHVHPGADNRDNVHCVVSDLERLGYTHGIAGDNHSGFLEGNFLVPGAFYRSRADEKDYKPAIGAVYEDGSICRYCLNVSNDEFVNDEELAILLTKGGIDTTELIECLEDYKKVSTDFFDMVQYYAKKNRASENVKRILTEIKDKAGEK